MYGILTGMKITLKHFFGRKVTRMYPYEKRVLPPRSRGLIQYLRDDQGRLKCEGCLFCEKICPPQAITVSHRPRESHRDRPLTLPQAVWSNFQRSRRALLSHQSRPELAVGQREPSSGDSGLDWQRVTAHLDEGVRSPAGLSAALGEIQAAAGYLPRHAVTRLSERSGIDLSAVYALATALPGFRTEPAAENDVAVCQCTICRNVGAKELASAVAAEMTACGGAFAPAAPHARCLGDVRQAPILRVGGRSFGNVSSETARQIVRDFLNKGGAPR